MSEGRHASFVIRVVQDGRGQISGVIERVATGAKEAFTSKEVIGQPLPEPRRLAIRRGERATPSICSPGRSWECASLK